MDTKVRIDIVGKRKIFLAISIIIIIAGVIGFCVRGFNLDIDFTGGTTQQYNLHKEITDQDIAKINDIMVDVTGEAASSIQITGSERQEILIKSKELSSETRDAAFDAIAAEFGLTIADRYSVDNVSPSVGSDMSRAALISIVVAVALMLVYITIRFSFKSGLSAIICLVHDVLVVLTFYVLFAIPINTSFIAAILTIVGYSINATIVLFDRVRENKKAMSRDDFANVVNVSIWQTMNRSILTSLTTFVMVLLICIMGVDSIRNFALPIVIGIICGTYSSVFLSGNFWYMLENKKGTGKSSKAAPAKAKRAKA
ncbi:MAG: protein translocase subunit SecF [Clostridia bacterium]|nr:protein translocase subunit SecF [Clostridia bacterium]MBQ1435776.1 protein translocase subunit SecF [Clostridia bacterium]MBQ4248893.1 protein translocase subunit SecF [Clostridia bacterium]